MVEILIRKGKSTSAGQADSQIEALIWSVNKLEGDWFHIRRSGGFVGKSRKVGGAFQTRATPGSVELGLGEILRVPDQK